MQRQRDAITPRFPRPSLLGGAIAIALILTAGAPAGAVGPGVYRGGEPAPESVAPRLSCLVAGDDANTLYGVYPTVESGCPGGLAVDLRLLRAALGLP